MEGVSLTYLMDFLGRNIDNILLIIIGVIIGILINNSIKIIKYISEKIKRFVRIIIRKIKGQYTAREVLRFADLSKDRLSKRQQKAVDNLQDSFKKIQETMLKNEHHLKEMSKQYLNEDVGLTTGRKIKVVRKKNSVD